MLIEDTIENVLVQYLIASTNGINIYRAMQDEVPNLLLPALIVTSQVTSIIPAQRELYRVRVIIEYKSVPENDTVEQIERLMGDVDSALTNPPSSHVLSGLNFGQAASIRWKGIPRTQQDVNTDRRTTTREIDVILAFS